jgi:hypothetical protein
VTLTRERGEASPPEFAAGLQGRVEIPRPHELPEDLQDLSWRDEITLDPFQDFDPHGSPLERP